MIQVMYMEVLYLNHLDVGKLYRSKDMLDTYRLYKMSICMRSVVIGARYTDYDCSFVCNNLHVHQEISHLAKN